MIQLIECPRDAMQGLHDFIPTKVKANYINQLLKVGFHTIDFGSFVSPKAIPQMRDTKKLVGLLDLSQTSSSLLSIVANKRGALDACLFEEVDYLGYPFSISETFQIRNTNATISKSVGTVAEIQDLCVKYNKKLVLYLSMGFGNPYGDPWSTDIVHYWVDKLREFGINIFSLSDTIGVANPNNISYIFSSLIPAYEDITFGAHFHTEPHKWKEKIESAYEAGCRRFDSSIKGYGGCPMAKDDLIGNMATENIIFYLNSKEVKLDYDLDMFIESLQAAASVFPFKY